MDGAGRTGHTVFEVVPLERCSGGAIHDGTLPRTSALGAAFGGTCNSTPCARPRTRGNARSTRDSYVVPAQPSRRSTCSALPLPSTTGSGPLHWPPVSLRIGLFGG